MSKPRIFDLLCDVCQNIFHRVRRDMEVQYYWYHNISNLIKSADSGCHFCTIVLDSIPSNEQDLLQSELDKLNRESPLSASKQVKVEIRYYEAAGLTFMLRRRNGAHREFLASVDFTLGGSARKLLASLSF